MENILRSIVKIIIIGAFYEKGNVDCNRQFLARPPLPYYQNEDYYVPGFGPTFHNQVPIYYQDQNIPPPISYQNMNPHAPPQLFYQNENYIPPPVENPGMRYPSPQVLPYKQSFQPIGKPQQNFGYPRVEYKKPLQQQQVVRPQEVSKKKTEAFASNIVVKDEPLTPFYQDDYTKNYNDDDYIDNYSDESPVTPVPCPPNSPYRYFEAPKGIENKYSLCNPNFQQNFGNSVYEAKMPITLLPSRFPPRVEQLIERIQNYFSTYTEQETPNPPNNTMLTSTPQTPTVTPSESVSQLSVTTEISKDNKTVENQEVTISPEVTTVGNLNQVTEKTVVMAVETEVEPSSTTAPSVQIKKETQMGTQMIQTTDEVTESLSEVITEMAQGTTVEVREPYSEIGLSQDRLVTEPTISGTEKGGNSQGEGKPLSVESSSTPAEDVEKTNGVTEVTPTNSLFQNVTSDYSQSVNS